MTQRVCLNVHAAWTKTASKASRKEGWDMFDSDGVFYIQRFDEDPQSFTDDSQAAEYCVREALRGSKRHLLALYLDGRRSVGIVDIVRPLFATAGVRTPQTSRRGAEGRI